jgi:hypothetical protein
LKGLPSYNQDNFTKYHSDNSCKSSVSLADSGRLDAAIDVEGTTEVVRSEEEADVADSGIDWSLVSLLTMS